MEDGRRSSAVRRFGFGLPQLAAWHKGKEGSWTPDNECQFRNMLRIIEESHVPLAALWVFELPSQNADYNITADNERSYQLREVAAANARVQGGAATR